MKNQPYLVEAATPFANSLIWDLNRKYYHAAGVDAWRTGTVPHQLTSNSMVGKTYAELILGILKDIAYKGQLRDTVYILEMGAGHGRLAFHILQHLNRLIALTRTTLPPFCYVLSDIVEDDLSFFLEHPQFADFYKKGTLDVCYFDGTATQSLELRYAKKTILPQDLNQPLVAIGNYFFDSLPIDLFHIQNQQIASCSIALSTENDPKDLNAKALLEQLKLKFYDTPCTTDFYKEPVLNEILANYQKTLKDTHVFFPYTSFQCLENLQELSNSGLIVLSMDKGFHKLEELEKETLPEMIPHGGISFWVNYHAFGQYCKKHGGTALFPSFATRDVELGCLFFVPDAADYADTKAAYEEYVNDFGPDDFNGLKEFSYRIGMKMTLTELIIMMRLSAYDSTVFINLLPRVKKLMERMSRKQRYRLGQTMRQTWSMYFMIHEPFDLAYEMGGMFYDLGYYEDALEYFGYSVGHFGVKADIYYNQALCYYQLREDALFSKALTIGKARFPDFKGFLHLEKLDLGA